ncbi:E3 ubiquitin-protein ligase DCST1 [Ctenocephalides felis]|uniref:E3 ubiquitin-protein ligase DCST1 n=1 Tax=Ctenocephalides felis TaxID=7515 RepID=UPI000E6E22BD|nr:E3 ubiquitin-protein ligase DCST1 [Ctenocephalides felis]
MSFGNAHSIQIRCICLLSFLSFCGNSGRTVLKTLVLAYVISGPIQNLATNAKEVIRVFTCSTTLTYNLTKTRFDLMTKPFHEAFMSAKADMTEVKNALRSFREVSAPIIAEVEGTGEVQTLIEVNDYLDVAQGDTKRSIDILEKTKNLDPRDEAREFEMKYLRKLELRCEAQLTKGAEKCRKMFGKAYDACRNKVSWAVAWLLCWPMKLTFVCNIARALGGSGSSGGPCDAATQIDPGLGEGYAYMKRTGRKMSGTFKQARIQYRMIRMNKVIDYTTAADATRALVYNFKEKKSFFDGVMVFVKRFLSFIFLRILFAAQKYHDDYLSNIDYDNVYLTRYFKKIDARRHKMQRKTLLPLKKAEKLKLLDPTSLAQLKSERGILFGLIVKLLLEMITATTFLLLDRLFFETLDFINRHARIDFTQEGHHDIFLQVGGVGLIASMLRSVLNNFNIKKRVKTSTSNFECLPVPDEMPLGYVFRIYGTYFVVLTLLIIEGYTRRFRRAICAYFYPKREKRRILHLYNTTLKRRVGMIRQLKRKVRRQAREHKLAMEINLLLALRMKYPKIFSWLKIFPQARRKCIICQDREPFRK